MEESRKRKKISGKSGCRQEKNNKDNIKNNIRFEETSEENLQGFCTCIWKRRIWKVEQSKKSEGEKINQIRIL